jgi:hypothetical protein
MNTLIHNIMGNNRKINSLDDLQHERELLKEKIHMQEAILRGHYTAVTEQFSPAFKIINFISGNRLFKGIAAESKGADWISILLKVLVAGTTGGFLFKKTKKNLAKALLAYALDQGLKYVRDKDISEHIEKLKEWLKKKKDEDDEEEEEETDEEMTGQMKE